MIQIKIISIIFVSFLFLENKVFSHELNCLRFTIDFTRAYNKSFFAPMKDKVAQIEEHIRKKKFTSEESYVIHYEAIQSQIIEMIELERELRPSKTELEELALAIHKELDDLVQKRGTVKKTVIKHSGSEVLEYPFTQLYMQKTSENGFNIFLFKKNNQSEFEKWFKGIGSIEQKIIKKRLKRISESGHFGNYGTLLSDNHSVKSVTIYSLKMPTGGAPRVFYIITKKKEVIIVGQVLKQSGDSMQSIQARKAGENVLELLSANPDLI